MAFKAKTREEAVAYFAGWDAAEFDDKGNGLERPDWTQHLDNLKAFDAGYLEYNIYGKE